MTRLNIGDNFPREFPGDTWNRLVDLLEEFQQIGGPDQLLQLVNQAAVSDAAGMVVNVVNKTGDKLDENDIAIVKKDSFVFDPPTGTADEADHVVLGGVQLEVAAVTSDNQNDPFVITIDPIPDDGMGRAYLPGASWARLDIQNEDDTTAGPQDGDRKCLRTGQGGTPILAKPAGTGQKWGIVQLGASGGSGRTVLTPYVLTKNLGGAVVHGDESFDFGEGTEPDGYKIVPSEPGDGKVGAFKAVAPAVNLKSSLDQAISVQAGRGILVWCDDNRNVMIAGCNQFLFDPPS